MPVVDNMKIYINQNEQKFGPHSTEEVRDLVYRGEVQRTSLAQVEGESNWVPVDVLLSRPQSRPLEVTPPRMTLSIEQLRDPK